MWVVNGTNLFMAVGDFGVVLPVRVSGIQLGANDSAKLCIRSKSGTKDIVLEKTFSVVPEQDIQIVFTEVETNQLPIGLYSYSLDLFRDGVFLCNIVPLGSFKVGEK